MEPVSTVIAIGWGLKLLIGAAVATCGYLGKRYFDSEDKKTQAIMDSNQSKSDKEKEIITIIKRNNDEITEYDRIINDPNSSDEEKKNARIAKIKAQRQNDDLAKSLKNLDNKIAQLFNWVPRGYMGWGKMFILFILISMVWKIIKGFINKVLSDD